VLRVQHRVEGFDRQAIRAHQVLSSIFGRETALALPSEAVVRIDARGPVRDRKHSSAATAELVTRWDLRRPRNMALVSSADTIGSRRARTTMRLVPVSCGLVARELGQRLDGLALATPLLPGANVWGNLEFGWPMLSRVLRRAGTAVVLPAVR
jgi:hypothetical protein